MKERKKNNKNNLINKIFNREVILYVIFGVVSTLVNWVTFYVLTRFLNMGETETLKNTANFIAIVTAALVAYITNKNIVFQSKRDDKKETIKEFGKFMLGRAFTIFLEWILGLVLFLTPIPDMITKVFVTAVIVILNYFVSKFYAFKK